VTRVARGDTAQGTVTREVLDGDTPELPPFLVARRGTKGGDIEAFDGISEGGQQRGPRTYQERF